VTTRVPGINTRLSLYKELTRRMIPYSRTRTVQYRSTTVGEKSFILLHSTRYPLLPYVVYSPARLLEHKKISHAFKISYIAILYIFFISLSFSSIRYGFHFFAFLPVADRGFLAFLALAPFACLFEFAFSFLRLLLKPFLTSLLSRVLAFEPCQFDLVLYCTV
jgi:hypothetical protein